MSNASSHIAWEGASWRLRVQSMLLPDGSTLERGFVEHPGSVVLIPIRDSAAAGPEVLMLSQYRPAIGETILELPAGTRGWDEPWLACAQRELREETGFRAKLFSLLGDMWPAPSLTDELIKLYLASGLQSDPLPPDADEEIEVRPMLLSKLILMARDGRLVDAKSVVGILRAAALLEREPAPD